MKRALLILALCLPLSATTYYVDCAAANDAGAGTAIGTAWKTVAKVNASTFASGDSVLFNKGCAWRETLTVPSGGSAGNPITFGAYGSGARPILTATNAVTGWAAVASPTEDTGGTWHSGFESGGLADFSSTTTSGGTVTASATAKDHGSYGLLVTVTNTADSQAKVTKTFTAITSGSVYARVYMYVPAGTVNASATSEVFNLYAGGTDTIRVQLVADGSGSLKLNTFINNPYAQVSASNFGDVTRDVWHYIDICYVVSATVGGGQVWLDGVSKGSSSFNQNTSANHPDRVSVGQMNFGSVTPLNSTYRFDDVKLATTGPIGALPGAPPNAYSATLAASPVAVWLDGTRGTAKGSVAAMSANNDYYYDSGATTLNIVSTGDPSARTIEVPSRQNAITTNGKDYISVVGLSLTGGINADFLCAGSTHCVLDSSTLSGALFSCYLTSGATGANTVTNNVFTDCGQHGTLAQYVGGHSDSGGNLYSRNTISGTGWNPAIGTGDAEALTTGASSDEISYNTIHDSIPLGTSGLNDGISVGGAVAISGIKIHDNTVYNIPYGSCIWLEGEAEIYRNSGNNCVMAGVTLYSTLNSVKAVSVHHNILRNGWNGLTIGGVTYQALFNLTVSHNDFISNANTTYSIYTQDVNLGYNLSSLAMKDNIFSGVDLVNGTHNEISGVTQTNATIDYNLYQYGTKWYNSGMRSWAAWQGYGFDTHGVNLSDPLFINAGTGDFRLGPGSPAIKAGTYIAGVSTSNPPDIGALQTGRGNSLMFSIP